MAQVYVPDDPRVREQLEQGGTAAAREEKRMPPARRRRFGVIDLVVFLGVVAAITLLVLAASRWTAPLTPNVAISLSPAVLPAYAGYSLLRMLLAYLLSLVFTLIYGHVAANNRRAERVMILLLDILQSVPILSFLPAVTLTLVALFPHSNIGLELASVILIFTSQAWNMTFSFYHSARTLPTDLQEVTTVARVRPWRRFLVLEVPSSLIVLLDLLFWRPLVAWADKFKVEQSSGADTPHSPVLDALRRSALVALVNRRVFRPLGQLLARLLDRLQPLPGSAPQALSPGQSSRFPPSPLRGEGRGEAQALSPEQSSRFPSPRRIAGWVLAGLLGALVLLGLVSMFRLLVQVPLPTWGTLLLATLATWLRTLTALLIGVAWTVPAGVAIGLSPKWSRRLQPVVQVVASIPATALFPILLLALVGLPGGLSLAAILLMLLGTQWYILFNVIAGAMAIPSDLREATTVYHASGWRKWRTLILPAIFPYLITGLLTASGGAWNASIVSEYVQFNNHIVSTFGLGSSIASAAAATPAPNFPVLLAATLLMAAFVVILNRLVWKRLYGLAERRYTLG